MQFHASTVIMKTNIQLVIALDVVKKVRFLVIAAEYSKREKVSKVSTFCTMGHFGFSFLPL